MTPMMDPGSTASRLTAGTGPVNLLDLTPDEAERVLVAFMHAHGQAAYRARQVLHHLWEHAAPDFASVAASAASSRAESEACISTTAATASTATTMPSSISATSA